MKLQAISCLFLFLLGSCASQTTLEKSNSLAQTDSLIGKWNLEKQFSWNPATNQWEPGIVLYNGTFTEKVEPPLPTEIQEGLNPEFCSCKDENIECFPEKNAKYVTIMNGGCWIINGKQLTPYQKFKDTNATTLGEWSVKNNALEIILVTNDPDLQFGEVVETRQKAVYTKIN